MGLSQKQLQKKRTKRNANSKAKQKRQQSKGNFNIFEDNAEMEQAINYPIYQCLQSEDMFEKGMGTLIVSRKENNRILAAFFLVDTYCLGIKDAFIRFMTENEYRDYSERYKEGTEYQTIHPTCARKLVEGAVKYAKDIGISPCKNYGVARKIFGDVDSLACPVSFKFGREGKPFFFAGADDSVQNCKVIINTLKGHLGVGGFDYMIPFAEEMLTTNARAAIKIESAIDEVDELLERSAFKQANKKLDILIKKQPKHPQIQFMMGVLFIRQNKLDEAIPFFEAAIEISPNLTEARFNLAVVYKEKLDIANMLKGFQGVVQFGEPHDPLVQQAQGILDDMEETVREIEGVDLQTYTKSNEIFDAAFNLMKNDELEKAIELFEEVISLSGRNPKPHGNLGICYSRQGKKQRALAAFDKALEIDPTYEIAMVNRAIVESMEEGQPLKIDKIKEVKYGKDYPL